MKGFWLLWGLTIAAHKVCRITLNNTTISRLELLNSNLNRYIN